jgi:hypothetical protein
MDQRSKEEKLMKDLKDPDNSSGINKAISKCRDSYRVSKEDKEFLQEFKR